MGFDIAVVDAKRPKPNKTGILMNNATSATFRFVSGSPGNPGEISYPGVFTFATNLFQPSIPVTKLVHDLNGGAVLPGDVLEYIILLPNNGGDDAVNVVLWDPIPAGTSYVLGSLDITAGANAGVVLTDNLGMMSQNLTAPVWCSVSAPMPRRVRGGRLARGVFTTVRFRVQIPTTATLGTTIANTAVATYNGATLGTPYTTSGTKDVVVGRDVRHWPWAKT